MKADGVNSTVALKHSYHMLAARKCGTVGQLKAQYNLPRFESCFMSAISQEVLMQ